MNLENYINGGKNKVHTGPKNGKYVIIIKDDKRIKKYITKYITK